MHAHSHVRSLFMPSSVRQVLFLVCFLRPLPPSPVSFLLFLFLFFFFSTSGFIQCDRCSGVLLVAGVRVGKATGVVYLRPPLAGAYV